MKIRRLINLIVLIAVLISLLGIPSPVHAAGTIYVEHNATGTNDGSSWANAYTDLQSALTAAASGNQIWVAAGTYLPTLENCGTGPRFASFQLKNGVALYGGFAGIETSLSERNWNTNVVILSGDIGGPGVNSDNSYHVFCHPQSYVLNSTAVLDGFTITGGNANSEFDPFDRGGGMINEGNNAPTLRNLLFFNNSAKYGGGLYNSQSTSNPALINVIFASNSATDSGGGIYNLVSSPTLFNVIFIGNSAPLGAGMYNNSLATPGSASPTLTNVTFYNNSASAGGGAIYDQSSSNPVLANCILWGDSTGEIGSDGTGAPVITYSDIQGGIVAGTGNISQDPLFVNAASGDLHLQETSPAIDAGDNSVLTTTTDLDGNPRIVDFKVGGAIVDLGAYEAQRPIRYVNKNAPGSVHDGTSWAHAYTDLQSALLYAISGDQIWVAAGTYTPGAPGNRTATFQLDDGVAIYGGFAGTETSVNQREWRKNAVILSGDLNGNGIDDSDSYHVVTGDNNAILDGFTIIGGNADGNGNPDSFGGGLFNDNSSPALTNLIISGNSAKNGGGLSNFNLSNPALTNVIISGNVATLQIGGGMYNYNSNPVLTNVTFSGNVAPAGGGAIYDDAYSISVVRNSILWGDAGAEIFGSTSVSYSIVEGGFTGEGNLDADPLFILPVPIGSIPTSLATPTPIPTPMSTYTPTHPVGTATPGPSATPTPNSSPIPTSGGNLRLQAGSPAIDAGETSVVTAITDLDGNHRSVNYNGAGVTVDMGAYEAQVLAGILYVDGDAPGPRHNGRSWAQAFTDVQTALSIAVTGSQIWVAAGTYLPSVEHCGTGSHYRSFQLKNGVTLYGGFDPSSGDSTWASRNWTKNITIFSGDIGTPNVNSYHVFCHPQGYGLDSTAVLDGFTITGGNAYSIGDPDDWGGGMYNIGGSPTLTNVTFSGNFAKFGGGLYNDGGTMTLTHVIFSANQVPITDGGTGGGIFNESSGTLLIDHGSFVNNQAIWGSGVWNRGDVQITNTTFTNNSSTVEGAMDNYGTATLTNVVISNNTVTGGSGVGGGMINFTTATLTDVTFSGNSAYNGGGLYNANNSITTLTRVTFNSNTAASNGGGMYNNTVSSLALTGVTFSANTATANGGGIYNNTSNPTLINTTFSGNAATGEGGGIYNNSNSNAILTNVTITGNTASGGGGIFSYQSYPSVSNSILWHDTNGEVADDGGTTTISFSIVEGGFSGGTVIINNDPNFVAAVPSAPTTGGNLHLQTGSPAINAGDNTSLSITTDLDGNPRLVGATVDLGAYEYQGANLPPVAVNDKATMVRNKPTTIDVLSNDSDPDHNKLSVIAVTQPSNGSVSIDSFTNLLTYSPALNFYDFDTFTYSVSDGLGGTATASVQIVPANDNWARAYNLKVSTPATIDQTLDRTYQSRWYKFDVLPGSQIQITLINLPADYNLTFYRDISAAYKTLKSKEDLVQLSAEFAPDMFSPDMFSPDMFSPDMFSPDMFSPDMFSPDMFSPDMFSPDMFSPDMFSPDMFSPDMFSPDMFSPDMFSPDMFSPDMFSPDMFSPDMFSPDMFSPDPYSFASAQIRSMLAVSANAGKATEGIRGNSWNMSGEFYVRVSGKNGTFDPDQPFHLEVTVTNGTCSSVDPSQLPVSTLPGSNGSYQTIVITDLGRMAGTDAEKASMVSAITSFTNRAEVKGVWVDIGLDNRVSAANHLADDNPGCPYAKNLVADSIKGIINRYIDAGNPLKYIVLIGNDNVIPFYRYPDNALLANEMDYTPPVLDNTASQASLKLGYYLGQDEYGSKTDLVQKDSIIPIPDLAVGRLVETPAEVMNMLSAYSATDSGVLPASNGLVMGYDFLADDATAVGAELQAGMGQNNVASLVSKGGVAPQSVCPAGTAFDGSTCSWTASNAKDVLLNQRHDVIFIAGHFSASSMLAADDTTRLLTADLLNSPVNLQNTLIYSAGCHSGYNIVNSADVPGVTVELDWAQAFARKGATFIGGTGYQYGDTDFIEYSERLYLEFTQQLRLGTGPVPLGSALVAAKQEYLANTATMSGIHAKSVLEATLFGLPMASINLPAGRGGTPAPDATIVSSTSITNPPSNTLGGELGLGSVDITISPTLTEVDVPLNNPPDKQAVYISGKDGVVSNPAQPVLPLEMYNVSAVDSVLRGVGFRGGSYTDLANILPLTGATATDIRGVHTPFNTNYFFPVLPWTINYFDALAGEQDGATHLVVLPAQYRSSSVTSFTGTLRKYNTLNFRLYYSANITTYINQFTPAQSAPPLISGLMAIYDAATYTVNFQATVVGDPTAGIQEVWIVFTTENGQGNGVWAPVDLQRNSTDSRIWTGSLALPQGVSPSSVRYIVQAVNGVGLVSYATNQGAYYIPGSNPEQNPPATQDPTAITLTMAGTDGYVYGSSLQIAAEVTDTKNKPVSGGTIEFTVGAQSVIAISNETGHAEATVLLLGMPGETAVSASLLESEQYASSSASGSITVTRQATHLTLTPQKPTLIYGKDSPIIATLREKDDNGNLLPNKSILFEVRAQGSNTPVYSEEDATNFSGEATLTLPTLPTGQYTLSAQFGNAQMPDPRYLTTSIQTDLIITSVLVDAGGPYTVDEGSSVTLTATGNDPESGSLTYAWDLDNNGTFETSGQSVSFTGLDGPSDHMVTVKVTDSDGSTAVAQATVHVNNVAPTATFNAPVSVSEGSSFTLTLTNPVDVAADLASLHYAFACDGESLASATYATSGVSASTTCTFSDGPSTHTVLGRVIDKDGGYTDYSTVVTANNVAPKATFSNNGPIPVGGSVTVSFTNPNDPSTADLTSLHYAFACDGGSLATATYATSGASASATCTVSGGSGTRTVRGRVIDKDGGNTEYTTVVTVNNLVPTVSVPFLVLEPSLENTPVIGAAIFSDLSGAASAPFTCTINYGDGSGNLVGTVIGYICIGPIHTYKTFGSYTVTVNVTDKDKRTGSNKTTHTVIYKWMGFFQPVDNLPVVNVAKAGSAIPVKFSLGGNKGLSIFMTGYPQSTKITCDPGSPMDDIEQTVSANSSSLTYDPITGLYTYIWKTDKSWSGTCRQLVLKLADGTQYAANFMFK